MKNSSKFILDLKSFPLLLEELRKREFQIIAPSIKEHSIVYKPIEDINDLPVGYSDDQNNGYYRVRKSDHDLLFAYTVGQNSLKEFLYPAERSLLQINRIKNGFTVNEIPDDFVKSAFLGVRACDLAALGIHDKILSDGQYADQHYRRRRRQVFIIAVNCISPGNTCFCQSMGTGPAVTSGYDLVMTEIGDSQSHYFVIESGSASGRDVLEKLALGKAGQEHLRAEKKALSEASSKMGRTLEVDGLKEDLYRNFDSPHWQEVTNRCLACGNCTMVCPTCFCMNTEDSTDLSGETAERRRRWDSCFNLDFSYIHGGSIRFSEMSRYRQWLMHKLAYWQDQFGSFGCVGCGRCITWCPVGIDITEEALKVCEKT